MNKKMFLVGILGMLVVLPVSVFGATLKGGESLFIDSASKVEGNLYAGGSDVNVSAPISGDLYSAGGNVNVSGEIKKDLTLAGGSIYLSGNVGEDLRLIGGNVTITSPIGGEMFIFGGSVNVTSESKVKGDADIFAGNLNYYGEIGGNLSIMAEKVYLNGKVMGNLSVDASELVLGPNASIEGNLDYTGVKEAVLEEGAIVKGEMTFEKIDQKEGKKGMEKGLFLGLISFAFFIKFIIFTLISLVLFYALKNQSKSVIEIAKNDFWKSALRGFVMLIVVPIASIILFITFIGWPIGLFAMLIYFAIILASLFFNPLIFGRIVLDLLKKNDLELNWWMIVLSVLVLSLICIIPIIGWILLFILFLSSFGSLSLYLYRKL